jgi:hypothetical protein
VWSGTSIPSFDMDGIALVDEGFVHPSEDEDHQSASQISRSPIRSALIYENRTRIRPRCVSSSIGGI